jgi:hypothetical protein
MSQNKKVSYTRNDRIRWEDEEKSASRDFRDALESTQEVQFEIEIKQEVIEEIEIKEYTGKKTDSSLKQIR